MPTRDAFFSEETMVDDDIIIIEEEENKREVEGPQPLGEAFMADTVTPVVSSFKDHFTLPIPSSVIRYRNLHSAARILETSDAQFVLEDLYDEDTKTRQVSIRRIHDTSEGVRVLRLLYAIVAAFWTGFLFILCLQILLFLFLDVAIQSGATSVKKANWGRAIGTNLFVGHW